ncbi:hypothetical protein [Streptomyces palmae]|uniref:Uncharacterized protein n=1 Tax=Streptomyces palmae TaxID=1701085 RepID=A0A4Z0H991_9ACTN|nr:hypothetical protein [Streptomyces palmae]TGB10565.1 hypothetical protein E4099_12620 [Streptomyces palmae]
MTDPRNPGSLAPGAYPDPSELADRYLVLIERAYPGSVERQYADGIYCVRDFNRQTGGIHLALRGLAASYAVRAEPVPAVRVGKRTLDTLPDPRASLGHLIAEGGTVWVEEPDLAALGASAAARLLPGVHRLPAGGLAALLPAYRQVWFM